jgi:hypothetical protein
LANAGTLCTTLQSLGCSVSEDAEIADWLTSVHMLERWPVLIRAGLVARDWMNLPGMKERKPDGIFLAACLWREKTPVRRSPCPSGRRRSSVITAASCNSGWRESRNFANA